MLLLAIVHHAFITLFLDYSGGYERSCRRYMPLLLACLLLPTLFLVSPSALYSRAAVIPTTSDLAAATGREAAAVGPSHFRQYCDLEVPPLLGGEAVAEGKMAAEAAAAYRLCYEVIHTVCGSNNFASLTCQTPPRRIHLRALA